MTDLASDDNDLRSSSSFLRRKAVSSPHIDAESARTFRPRHVPKSVEELKSLHAFLIDNCLFVHLDEQGLNSILDAMQKLTFKSGDVIAQQGKKGDNFYLLNSGQVGVVINGERVSKIREGGTFGELELMYDTPCASTIVAESPEVTIWSLDRNTYKLLVMSVFISQRKEYEELLGRVPIFRHLTASERTTMADALTPCTFSPGDYVVRFGEEGDWLYIVEEGVVILVGRSWDQEPVTVCELTDGGWFGDLEFVNNHTNVVDVVAKSTVKIVKLNRYHIELCMGTIKEMLRQNMCNPVYEYYRERMLARTIKFIGRGGRRRAPVSSETYEPYDIHFPLVTVPKTAMEASALAQRLQASALFSGFAAEELEAAVDVMSLKTFGPGDTVVRQGETEDHLFVIESGTCSLQVDDAEPKPLGPGQCFGEMELLYNTPCLATIQATTDVRFWTIDRPTYRHVMMKGQLRKRQRAMDQLTAVPIFNDYSAYQCLIVAEYMQVMSHKPGDVVVQHGKETNAVCVLLDGTLQLEGTTGQSLGQLQAQDQVLLGAEEISRGVSMYHISATAVTLCRVGIIPADKMGLCLLPALHAGPSGPAVLQNYYAGLVADWPTRRVGHYSHIGL